MDLVEDFQVWAVAQAKLAPDTVRYTVGRLRFMEKAGLSWSAFLASPDQARRLGDQFLGSPGKHGGSRHALRTYEKALNLAARYAKAQRPDLIWPMWDLTKEPKSEGKTFTDDQVQAMLAYQAADPVTQARRRALAWLAFWTRLRRSEIARLRTFDFNADTRRVWVEYPAKGGRKRWVPIPGNAWHPNGALQVWLRRRPQPGDSKALWTARHRGRVWPMGVDGIGMEFQRMGWDLGFPVSFVRSRRAGTQFLQRHKVRTRIIKATLSHSSETVTERYMAADNVEAIEAEFESCKVPGFINRSRGHSGSRAWTPGDFGDSGPEPNGLLASIRHAVKGRANAPDAHQENDERKQSDGKDDQKPNTEAKSSHAGKEPNGQISEAGR